MYRYGFALIALSLASTACGSSDDDAPAGQAGTVNEDVAKASTRATIQAVTTATTSDDGQGAAGQLMVAAQQAQGIVTPSVAGVGAGTNAGTCDCDETAKKCTFQDCSDNDGEASMSGTIAWGNDKVTCDLTFTSTQQGLDFDLTTKCDLTTSDSTIDGTLSSTGNVAGITLPAGSGVSASSGTYGWSVTSKFNAVTYSGGSATGGSVDVDATYTIVGQNYVGSATVEFP